MEPFAKIDNGFEPLTIFAKISVLEVRLASKNATVYTAVYQVLLKINMNTKPATIHISVTYNCSSIKNITGS